jgi:hypothetical protein
VVKKEAEREEGETCVVRIYIRLVRACVPGSGVMALLRCSGGIATYYY